MRQIHLHVMVILAAFIAMVVGCNDESNSDLTASPSVGGATTGNGGATTGNGGAATGNGGAATGNGGAATVNGGAATGNGGAATGNGGAATGNGGAATGNGGAATGNGGATTGNGGAATGNGGAATSAGGVASIPATQAWTFDTGVQAWSVSWGDPATIQTGTVVAHDATAGDPAPGSLKLTIPFSGINQKVHVAVSWAAPVDISSKTVTARIRLDAGLTCGAFPGGAKLFVKWVETAASGAAGGTSAETWNYADSGWVNLVASATAWQALTFNGSGVNAGGWIETGKTYNGALVRQIGIEIDTSGDATATGCSEATLHIDTVGY